MALHCYVSKCVRKMVFAIVIFGGGFSPAKCSLFSWNWRNLNSIVRMNLFVVRSLSISE